MTNDDALRWCALHSVVAVFHEGKIVLVIPYKKVDVTAFKSRGFKIEVKDGGFAMAHSDPGDQLKDVVEAARAAWLSKASPIDRALEASGSRGSPIKFAFETDMTEI